MFDDSSKLASDVGLVSFHFSYIVDLSSGQWSYSNINSLFDLAIIESSEDVEKLIWRALIIEEDLTLYDDMFDKVRRNSDNLEIHYHIRNLQGQILHIIDHCGIIITSDRVQKLEGTIVCDNKYYEKVLKAEQQAFIGKLAGGMVHDFRNILSGIQNIIEWCGIQCDSESKINNALLKTISYTEQANSLISGILKLTGGQGVADPVETLYIGEIVVDLEHLIRHIISSSIAIDIVIEPGLPPIRGRRRALRDMIINLCTNAREAMKEKGDKLSVKVFQKKIDDSKKGKRKYIFLRVEDNGIGMSQEELNSIFDVFYSTRESGSGLGLWMVRESVRALAGRISVESEEGKGTVFNMMFPVIKAKKTRELSKEVSDSESVQRVKQFTFNKKKTILVLEDEPLIRTGITSWLDTMGANVFCADNGNEGWNLFNSHLDEIDLVIQDYIMPGLSGVELLEKLLQKKPELPVIIISGFSEGKKASCLLESGAYAFLPKPFKMEDLVDLLVAALNCTERI